jgi:hypothetical protein
MLYYYDGIYEDIVLVRVKRRIYEYLYLSHYLLFITQLV